MPLKDDLAKIIKGDILDDSETLDKFSTDASIFNIKPQLVVAPKDTEDIKALVKFINDNPKLNLSLTPRAAGTCMSGGAINDSIILDMTKYFNKVLEVGSGFAITQPGVFYRDFEKETLAKDLLLPCYTSSREICTVGGMVANNSAGEKTLSFGQTERYVRRLKVVLSDGNEYEIKPLTKEQLLKKVQEKTFEGKLYKEVADLIFENEDQIKKAVPDTSKNSTGYLLSKAWDGKIFDLNKVLVGSQGTLGIVTEIEFSLVHPKKSSRTVVLTLNSLDNLEKIINEVLTFTPESFECYDDQTLKAATKYLSEVTKDFKLSSGLSANLKLFPELIMKLSGNYPKLVLLAEFTGDTDGEVIKKSQDLVTGLKSFNLETQIKHPKDAEKNWVIRRQSFALLKNHNKIMRTAPFIDDIIVKPEHLPEFLPKLNAILDQYKDQMIYTLAGHIGNGNFHIIPLMNFHDEKIRDIIPEVAEKVFDLVFSFKGSMAAEHNDGLVRGPFLDKMYGESTYQLFKKTKEIFDPKNIFNPHKKTDATFEYSLSHLAK